MAFKTCHCLFQILLGQFDLSEKVIDLPRVGIELSKSVGHHLAGSLFDGYFIVGKC